MAWSDEICKAEKAANRLLAWDVQ